MTVLPVPPFGENTVTIRPCAVVGAEAPSDRRPEWPAFRIAKNTFSGICGRSRTSATSSSRACSINCDASPEASTMIGARVCSRITASSSDGSVASEVAWSTTWRWPPASAPVASWTCSATPTSSRSGWWASAWQSVADPSHDPVTKTRVRSWVMDPFVSKLTVHLPLRPAAGTRRGRP